MASRSSLGSSTDDDDPVIASYSVFVKPPLASHRQLLVFQQPNKHANVVPYGYALPFSEIRVKPRARMVEADLPIDTSDQYDKHKGMGWGVALQKSTAAKNGGSHGLPGGFGVGAPPPRPGRGPRGAAAASAQAGAQEDDPRFMDWNEAQRRDRVLRTQTLGGQAPELTDCRVMVGVFQGENLHLTPATNIIHLRPQLHHIDATIEQERLSKTGPGAASTAATAGTGQSGKEGASSARAIHMTIKSAAGVDGDEVVLETMADRLRAVQKEPWRRMGYVDENTDDAWDVYAESLILRPELGGGATQLGGEDLQAGEGSDSIRIATSCAESGAGGGDAVDLKEKVLQLEATWEDEKLLRAVSGIPAEEAPVNKTEDDVVIKKEGKGRGKQAAVDEPPPKKGRPGRPPKSVVTGTTVAKKTTGRGKAAAKGASSSNAMEVD